jgi:hypothetical protein
VSSLAFNCDGTRLAVGVSYTWDEGEAGLKTAERPMVVVRKVGDEVKVSFFFRFSVFWFLVFGFDSEGDAD